MEWWSDGKGIWPQTNKGVFSTMDREFFTVSKLLDDMKETSYN